MLSNKLINHFSRILISKNCTIKKLSTTVICHQNKNENKENKSILTIEENGIRNIILNNPKTRNALSLDVMTQLLKAIERNNNDENLRVIVLSGNGPVFSAGHNLKELTDQTGIVFHRSVFSKCTELMLAILNSPVPIIAKVDGLAAAAGCQLAASCDMIICSDKSTFSTPGANFGIFCSTPGIAVARTVPKMMSSYMLFTGLPISANIAFTSGLVSSVVPVEKLDEEIERVCEAIKSKSRAVIKLGKKFYYEQLAMNVRYAYKYGEEVMVNNIALEDGQEGIRSFVEKRKPTWTHSSDGSAGSKE